MGAVVADGGDLAVPEGLSASPAPPILLASTSPQRRSILEQLGIPFDVAAPRYEEHDPPDADPIALVCEHARGKALLGGGSGGGSVRCSGWTRQSSATGASTARPPGPRRPPRCSTRSAATTHEVVSGLCLLTPSWEEVEHEVTRVTFRPLTARDIAAYVASGEWESRAGAYAIQGLGAGLVERIEGDYLNVVGLPASLLVRLLAGAFAGIYGFG